MEVIATGRMTTFPGQSKYQLIVEDVAPAGAGALMAMLEKRRAALAGRGAVRPRAQAPIPYLPEVIGVVTSPSGAVIRDILHRLRDRFPRPVLIWPVAVQGQECARRWPPPSAASTRCPSGRPIPRPDVLIVARGGGSRSRISGASTRKSWCARRRPGDPADLGGRARDRHHADRLCRRPARADAHGGGRTGGAGAAGADGHGRGAVGAAEGIQGRGAAARQGGRRGGSGWRRCGCLRAAALAAARRLDDRALRAQERRHAAFDK
jgi:hypothetical protein